MSDGSMRAGPLGRKSQVEVVVHVRTDSPNEQSYFLVVSAASRNNDAVVIKIVPTTGELEFTNTPGIDVFPDVEAAKKHLTSQGRISIRKSGCALLGYAVVACNAWVLLATETVPTAYLPGVGNMTGHNVHTINECSWQVIPLQIRTSYPEQDLKRGEMLNEFAVASYHYFCETFDITRPYPSTRPPSEPCWEFVWNYYLTQAFRRVGLHDIAPHMLQGMAEMRQLPDMYGVPFQLVMFSRRSRLHAGTRYKARGLNNLVGPANEIECEQILFVQEKDLQGKRKSESGDEAGAEGKDKEAAPEETPSQNVRWSSYVWRRGSVPLRWSQVVKSNAVSTSIVIEPERTFSGSRKYFRRLQMRYHKLGLEAPEQKGTELTPEQRKDSLRYPIAVVNLLRKGSMDRDRSEARLYSAFCDLITSLNKQCGMNIINIGFDWHELAGTHSGIQPVVEMLWAASLTHFKGFRFTHGHLQARDGAAQPPRDSVDLGGGLLAVFEERQKGIYRFNCADSLDRTNVASFYSALQVLLEQGRSLDLAFVLHLSLADVFAPVVPAPTAMELAQGRAAGSIKKGLASLARGVNAAFGNVTAEPMAKVPSAGNLVVEPAYKPPLIRKPGDLPPGWEKRILDTGRPIYLNHKDKTSSWDPPTWPQYASWELVSQTITDMRRTIHRPLLEKYKSLFLLSGDRNAELYTGSPAMHSSQLDLLLGTGDAGHGISGFINNAHTAVRRRINNIVTDERTHSIFEMVLGLPSKASSGLATETFNQGISYELSAEAQKLPIADDPDSDEDDVINRIAWPAIAVTVSPSATPMAAADPDALPETAVHHRGASAPPAPTHAAPASLMGVDGSLGLELHDSFPPAYAACMPAVPMAKTSPVAVTPPRQEGAVEAATGSGLHVATAAIPGPSSPPDLLSFSPAGPEARSGEAGTASDPFAAVDASGASVADPFSSNLAPVESAIPGGAAKSAPGAATADMLMFDDPLGALGAVPSQHCSEPGIAKLSLNNDAYPELI